MHPEIESKDMRHFLYATVCSGVECCSLALNADAPTRGAWLPVFFSEIAPFPSAVLAHRYPNIPNLGDMTKLTVTERTITNGTVDIPLPGRIDLLAGGTPCQDFSLAGKRAGAAQGSGTRSSLCWDYLRLVKELNPRVILWENVLGCLSTNGGRDFSRFVAEVTRLGYGCAWRVLDSQYTRVDCWPMAIPQRRRRVWLVGVADGDAACAGEILFEPKGVLGNTPPRRETREGTSRTAASSAGDAYPTIIAGAHHLSGQGVEGVELILEPDHATLHDTARCIQGDHDSRVGDSANVVCAPALRARRLMPIECERLMGYPDDYTRVPYRGRPADQCPDGPRYEACGNGWAVNCARWVLLGIHRYLSNFNVEEMK